MKETQWEYIPFARPNSVKGNIWQWMWTLVKLLALNGYMRILYSCQI